MVSRKGMEFSKGRTNTRNRDYGWIYNIHHNIGTHVPNTQFLKAIACLKASAAYWRGNKDRESLQRVYGISYPDQKRLKVIFLIT
ncbi:threonine--tRNA ligase, mitochondrial 1-like [Helianthus annuus]|uniref:threonine--tRNA ligase, mitochondrial 1-like n=1 Tax=Helianthus annuus TaxID=4232 RepID=UPI001652F3DE|nr:threonine--tRNA ligase, mitochondrial 1-like [Helianthus annuus]